jgi:hypothetical protein
MKKISPLAILFLWQIASAQEIVQFENGQVADADDMNSNFNLLKDAIDQISPTTAARLTTGSGEPSPDSGDEGDLYIDTSAYLFYGPKGSEGWGSGISLIGPDGAAGPAGSQGDVGPAGPQGDTGATGPVGPQGDVGPAGPQGDTGATGPVGPQGDTGATGPVGPQGDVGPAGPQGDTGATGPVGPQGDVGPAGAQGPSGESGLLVVAGQSCDTFVRGFNSDGTLICAGVTLSISGPENVSEGSVTSPYTLNLLDARNIARPAGTDIAVDVTYSGTATDGNDYTSQTPITIPADSSSTTFDLETLSDSEVEGDETIILTISTADDGGFVALDLGNDEVTTTLVDTFSCGNTITDFDDNTYDTVEIAGDCWTATNARSSNYADGSQISVSGIQEYSSCSEFDSVLFGKLYNRQVALLENKNICPTGWHVSTSAEWDALGSNASGELLPGGSSGFNAIVAGQYYNGRFEGCSASVTSDQRYFWVDDANREMRQVKPSGTRTYTTAISSDTNFSYSVRCVRD